EKVFDRSRPILSCMDKLESVTYTGESGAGQIAKLCNQICIGGALAGVADAYALAKSSGIDRSRVRQALLGGFAGSTALGRPGNLSPLWRVSPYSSRGRLCSRAGRRAFRRAPIRSAFPRTSTRCSRTCRRTPILPDQVPTRRTSPCDADSGSEHRA